MSCSKEIRDAEKGGKHGNQEIPVEETSKSLLYEDEENNSGMSVRYFWYAKGQVKSIVIMVNFPVLDTTPPYWL